MDELKQIYEKKLAQYKEYFADLKQQKQKWEDNGDEPLQFVNWNITFTQGKIEMLEWAIRQFDKVPRPVS